MDIYKLRLYDSCHGERVTEQYGNMSCVVFFLVRKKSAEASTLIFNANQKRQVNNDPCQGRKMRTSLVPEYNTIVLVQ